MTVKKLALFVEGQTEQIFLKRLILEIAGTKGIIFDCKTLVRPGVLEETVWMSQMVNSQAVQMNAHRVLIVDCRGEDTVASTLRDQSSSLAASGYSLILGVRDLYPIPASRRAELEAKLALLMPATGVPAHLLLTVAEIEAWFVQEHSHFGRIDGRLNYTNFLATFGFDPVNGNAEDIAHPADLLHRIYSSVGRAYQKKRHQVERTVAALDYTELYVNLPTKLPQLKKFVDHLDGFLT